jgi:hypothetical protein
MIAPRSIALAIGYLAGLALLAATFMGPTTDEAPEIETPSVELPEIAVPPPLVIDPATYAAIVERPLFVAGRTPPAGPTAAEVVSAPTRPTGPLRIGGLRLAAVFREDETRRALVELPDGRSTAVITGDLVENWRVIEIGDDRLVVEQGGERRTLDLHDFSDARAIATRPAVETTTERRRSATRRRLNEPQRIPPRSRRIPEDSANLREDDD